MKAGQFALSNKSMYLTTTVKACQFLLANIVLLKKIPGFFEQTVTEILKNRKQNGRFSNFQRIPDACWTKEDPNKTWFCLILCFWQARECIKASWWLHSCHSTLMPASCACRCGRRVEGAGNFHKDCRLRITLAGGVCKPNVRRAADKRRQDKHNPVNNPKNSKKRKLALLAKNLQTVADDATLDETVKMTPGTSAFVSDWTHVTHLLSPLTSITFC